jgi:hypothetical protein
MNNALELLVGYFVYGYGVSRAVAHTELAADAFFGNELYPAAELIALFCFNERVLLRCGFFKYMS